MIPTALAPGTESLKSLQMIKAWLDKCDTNHNHCRHNHIEWLPSRLINVGNQNAKALPYLCSSSLLSRGTRYLTLSHCWGKRPIFRLLSSNIVDLQRYLPIHKLPKTFRDIIWLAQKLDIQYVWIDSLCIIQDSECDWASQSPMMEDVYANSYCNIAATGASDGQDGLFLERNQAAVRPLELCIPVKPLSLRGIPTGSYYCIDDFWKDGVEKAPLSQRAWVFQERFLSRRTVHFGSQQLFWECKELEACEIFPSKLPPKLATNYKKKNRFFIDESASFTKDISIGELLTAWCDLVAAYTKGHLTRQSDKLVAISGVAKRVARLISSEYLAGLWRVGFPGQLLWNVTHVRGSKAKTTRQQSYCAPSWSWASMDGPVTFVENAHAMESLVEIVNSNVTLLDTGNFGAVSDGHIQLRGRLAHVEFIESNDVLDLERAKSTEMSHPVVLKSQDSNRELSVRINLCPDAFPAPPFAVIAGAAMPLYTFREGIGSRDFFILPLCHCNDSGYIWGLILKSAGSPGYFQRLGMFYENLGDYKGHRLSVLITSRPVLGGTYFEDYDAASGLYTITMK
jgi:hypothetical protein